MRTTLFRDRKTGEQVEAVFLTVDNINEVARWCGGSIFDDVEGEAWLGVPSRKGLYYAWPGFYVIKKDLLSPRSDFMTFRSGPSFDDRFERV